MSKSVYVGNQLLNNQDKTIEGEFCQINGESFYKLSNVDKMRPFFMSIVSSEDHWLFMSSNKGITAGRKNSDKALFPYYTEDKLMNSVEDTGSKTILLVKNSDQYQLWEPFSERFKGVYDITRNLYKNQNGSQVIFEEVNTDLGLVFQERWAFSQEYGIIKTSGLTNEGEEVKEIQVLDGLQNILPADLSEHLQAIRSNLTDAYKKNELIDNHLGVYTLSAKIVDRAIPSEALYSTVAWSVGITADKILLSSKQINRFREGVSLETEQDVRAEKGAYFVKATLALAPGARQQWHIIADVGQSIVDLVALQGKIKGATDLFSEVEEDVQQNTKELLAKIAQADGIQLTQDQLITNRHLNNVMFNIMRGGLFTDNYFVEKGDFSDYLFKANYQVAERSANFLEGLAEKINIVELRQIVAQIGDLDLQRLACEYLPLSFSRRHGDPSRPWNKFNINTRDEQGNDLKYYEGNWRDIFQNWEALAISYPEYIENMILKFLNASTIDGYNPYRISSNGVDWEVSDPDDPWSYIGYWGDHQLIYLLKLLELYEEVKPGMLNNLLGHNYAVYANVPYRLKAFNEILVNPQDTVEYDTVAAEEIDERITRIGFDGKLVVAQDGNILRSTVLEKVLISVLTKISNFIPDAGIWMNTQRPEWNDANNALVGNGVSMVTLFQLRRYLIFLKKTLNKDQNSTFRVNEVIKNFLQELNQIILDHQDLATQATAPNNRRIIMEALGLAGEHYRAKAYVAFRNSQVVDLPVEDLLGFIDATIAVLDQTIRSNKRQDGLYHSYNILSYDEQSAEVGHLDLMLEGQVNVIASGFLSPGETLELLKALSKSVLYRADQNSYILYPDKQRALFLDRNNIPISLLSTSKLIAQLKADGNSDIVQYDRAGEAHFHPDFHNAEALGEALEKLAANKQYNKLVDAERKNLLKIYETVFNHKEFTGRSGTFYGYEGLGSIYWHMVSKLVESVSEAVVASQKLDDKAINEDLLEYYERLKDGIGVHKSPKAYGAVPTDPYSHTPGNRGVQQPGMTGQVKEDILSRFRELGVNYENGQISFSRGFFAESEFLSTPEEVEYLDLDGQWKKAEVNKDSILFTLCQVPVVYQKSNKEGLQVEYKSGDQVEVDGNTLPLEITNEIFSRTARVSRVVYKLT